jgi:hypothetical protein
MVAPFVFVEGLDVSFYPSLDDLTGFLEAQDVRAGVGEAFDAEGRMVNLAAASNSSPVTAVIGEPASSLLRARLLAYVEAIGVESIGVSEVDLATLDLASLVRSLWRFQRGGRSPSW